MNITQMLANVEFGPNCTAEASLSYFLDRLNGMESFQIDSVELIPGSSDVDVSFFGLNGASWDGVWNIVGSFADGIGIDAEAQLMSDACGEVLNETLNGVISAENPLLEFSVAMNGSSPSIFSSTGSLANSINVDDVRITFDSIVSEIDGFFGTNHTGVDTQFDLSTVFDGLFAEVLFDQVAPIVTDLLTNAFDGGVKI